jgi:hypothetical protein
LIPSEKRKKKMERKEGKEMFSCFLQMEQKWVLTFLEIEDPPLIPP